jgi:hypothetical protein
MESKLAAVLNRLGQVLKTRAPDDDPLWFHHELPRDGLWAMEMFRVRWRLHVVGSSNIANVGTPLQ